MSSSSYEEEAVLIQKCLEGEQEALAFLRARYLLPLRQGLLLRGASPTQADDIISNMWTDCVVAHNDRLPLLQRYNRRSTLRNWLFRVGINMLIDNRRRGSRYTEMVGQHSTPSEPDYLSEAATPWGGASHPDTLSTLLRETLEAAFASCPAEDLLRLRLVFLHGLTHREVARMWGCHESTLSRDLTRALQSLADETLEAVRRQDPHLRLTWEDFVELCESQRLDFL